MNIVYKSATHTRLLRKMTCVKPFRALVIIIKKSRKIYVSSDKFTGKNLGSDIANSTKVLIDILHQEQTMSVLGVLYR